jgi:hypothetical protein
LSFSGLTWVTWYLGYKIKTTFQKKIKKIIKFEDKKPNINEWNWKKKLKKKTLKKQIEVNMG